VTHEDIMRSCQYPRTTLENDYLTEVPTDYLRVLAGNCSFLSFLLSTASLPIGFPSDGGSHFLERSILAKKRPADDSLDPLRAVKARAGDAHH